MQQLTKTVLLTVSLLGDNPQGVSGELTMSQEEIKALIEKKRQEALRRLQNNRLKRAMIKK